MNMTNLFNDIKKFGFIYIYAIFFKVKWTQDFMGENGGYDILSLNSNRHYFTGTVKQRERFCS